MTRMQAWWRRMALVLTMAMAVLLPALGAMAADRVTLKDGRVVEGKIVREEQGYIWIDTKIAGIAKQELLSPADIASIEREAAAPKAEPAVAAPKEESKTDAAPAAASGAPRAAVITLGEGSGKDMVGIYMTAEQLRRLIPLLKEENVEIVVFRINSGGGMLLEVQRLSDVIHIDYRKAGFKVVSWIESAISAAAMTSHCIPEIYFMKKGNYGAATAFSGAGNAVKGRGLEEILYQMEKISARGGYPIEIARAMQIREPLSVNIDENGNVTWFQNEEGQHVINRRDKILTFNSETAALTRFSRGTADNIEELTKAMGYSELNWVGEKVTGVPYPVSKAERENRAWRNRVQDYERRTNEFFGLYQQNLNAAQGAQGQARALFVGKARENLENINRMIKDNPNFALTVLGILNPADYRQWYEDQLETLRRIMAPPPR